jgi:hypothetical protein
MSAAELEKLGGLAVRDRACRPNQRHRLRSLRPLRTKCALAARAAQSDQRLPTELGDQKARLAGSDRLR